MSALIVQHPYKYRSTTLIDHSPARTDHPPKNRFLRRRYTVFCGITAITMNWKQSWNSIPGKLSRITSSGRYLPEIDGLRFIAIMPVLIQHLSERLQRYSSVEWAAPVSEDPVAFLASRGTIGVFLFFAISGFILCLPFAKYHLKGGRKVPLKGYLWRRVTRLEPPYLIWMTVFFLVLLVQNPAAEGLGSRWGFSMIYLHNIVYGEYTPINPVAWSLEIEIQFYLLAPFLAALFFSIKQKALRRGILLGSIFGFISLQYAMGWMSVMPYKITLLGQLQHFLVGFLLADFYLLDWQGRDLRAKGWLDIVAVAAFFTLCFTWSAEWGKNLIFSTALIALFWAGMRGKWFKHFLRQPWIAAIGGMCYTIYLIHLPMMEGLVRITQKLSWTNHFAVNLLLQMAVVIPIVLAVSAVFFLLLEKPFMDKEWPGKLRQWLSGVWLGRDRGRV